MIKRKMDAYILIEQLAKTPDGLTSAEIFKGVQLAKTVFPALIAHCRKIGADIRAVGAASKTRYMLFNGKEYPEAIQVVRSFEERGTLQAAQKALNKVTGIKPATPTEQVVSDEPSEPAEEYSEIGDLYQAWQRAQAKAQQTQIDYELSKAAMVTTKATAAAARAAWQSSLK